MTEAENPVMAVVVPVRNYLEGQLPAPQLVRIVDDLVSENLLSRLDPKLAALVDELQLALALYAPDKMTRSEEPRILMGPFDLLKEVRKFDDKMRSMGY
jgi:hypothetical protein